MKPEERWDDPRLEEAVSAIRDEQIDAATVEKSAQRVWARISAEAESQTAAAGPEWIRSCADFQAMIPAWREKGLAQAEGLLFQDHIRDCVKCRKALEAASGKVVAMRPAEAGAKWKTWWSMPATRWAAAAMVVLAAGVTAWTLFDQYGPVPGGKTGVVQQASGMIYRVSDQGVRRLAVGEEFPVGAEIRTAKDSHAVVRLGDGSVVEMRERTGVSFSRTRGDLTVRLDRGSVIVQAAKRRTGHLYVDSRDCRVSVTGTVFAVSAGLKGSRVSVVEGEVHVAQANQETVLHAGDQVSTNASMTPVPVKDEIAWSQNLDQYLALLSEFSTLRGQLRQVQLPDLRYSSRLFGMLPGDTVIYAAIPNLGNSLNQARDLLNQRIQESATLRQWWDQKMAAGKDHPNLDTVIDEIRAFSQYLGDEVLLTASTDPAGKVTSPVFLAELKQGGFKDFAQAEVTRLSAGKDQTPVLVVDNLSAVPAGDSKQLIMLVRPEVVAISPDAAALARLLPAIDRMAAGDLPNTPFGNQIAAVYREGAGLLFAVDLQKVTAGSRPTEEHGVNLQSIANVKYLVAEEKQAQGKTTTRATLQFEGQRQSIASWLAAPAPMGALDYISGDAALVSAAVLKNPTAIVDDIFALQSASNPNFQQEVAAGEALIGLNIRDDVAAALGGEFAFAFDGPAVPTPAWKLVVEVYDPAKLRSTLQRLMAALNQVAAGNGKPQATYNEEVSGGLTYGKISYPGGASLSEVDYVISDGYLVAAPSRALVDKALQYKASGMSISRSSKFLSLVPRDQHANFSAVVYHNLGSTVGTVLEALSGGNGLTEQQQLTLHDLASKMQPMLIAAYGGPDQITLASNESVLGLGLGSILGIPGPMGMGQLLGKPGTHEAKHAYR